MARGKEGVNGREGRVLNLVQNIYSCIKVLTSKQLQHLLQYSVFNKKLVHSMYEQNRFVQQMLI